MDSTASDPQPQQQQQQQQHRNPQQQQPPPPQQQSHQQHPSKPQIPARPQQQQPQQSIQQHQQHQQHPQHAHQGQPQAAQPYGTPTIAQYPYYQNARYASPSYPFPSHTAYPYTYSWTPQQPANYSPVQTTQFAPSMVNSQPNPITYNIDKTHNQGLQQVNALNPSMISTAKPLTVRPKNKATLKTPDGKEIKLDDDSSKNPSTTSTTTSTTTTTAEHVHTLLQKVSEVESEKSIPDGQKSGTNGEKSDTVGEKSVAADEKSVTADEKSISADQKSEAVVEKSRHDDETSKPDETNGPDAETNGPNDEKSKLGEEKSKDDGKESKVDREDNEIHDVKSEADGEKNEEKDDKTEDKDECSNSLKYEPGQYHPINNTSGKKKYSREFLMDIRNRVEKAEQITFPPSIRTDPFDLSERFGYARHPGSRQNDSNRRQGQNNYSGRGSAGQEKQRKVITSVSLTQDVELKTSSNPWRPAKDTKDKEEAPQDMIETEVLKKKFRSILNKLTPNNFESLAESVTKLHIDNESKLGDVIDIVFAKALAEPGYCVLYGQMCSHLKQNTSEGANFGNTLLKRCQNQFLSDIYSGLNLEDRKKKIEDEQDPVVKKQLEEELYEDMYRCRMRGLGLIKFIGELYKIGMLNDAIMSDCVLRLLADQSEEALECLCDLLVTIGEKLDRSMSQRKAAVSEKDKSKTKGTSKPSPHPSTKFNAIVAGNAQPQKVDTQSLDYVFDQLHKMIKNNDSPISKRIRFKILDTCDLREKDKWQSKKSKDNNPKKIEEIRKAHEEKLEQEKREVNAMGPRRSQEHRRLGHSGGSSNQISLLANESGGHGRGNLHQSASSHILRDHPSGDMRSNHASDINRSAYQQSLAGLNILKAFKPSEGPPSKEAHLRPYGVNKSRNV